MITERVNEQLIVTFNSDDLVIVNWIESTYGLTEFDKLISNFIIQRKAQKCEVDKNDLWNQIQTSGTLEQVKAIIGVKDVKINAG